MKKKIGLISLIILITIIFIVINSRGRSRTIEEALGIGIYNNGKIIHEEKTDKGSIVFRIIEGENKKGLFTAFLNKNIFGYKDLYSGVASIEDNYPRELTNHYFPTIKDTDLPIYFGLIINDEITDVSVKQVDTSELKKAKIIDTKSEKIWLVYMEGFKGQNFEIIGYDKEGKEIYKLEETTSWRVEQEPMESPYK